MGNVGKDGNHVSINGHENRAGVLHLRFSTGCSKVLDTSCLYSASRNKNRRSSKESFNPVTMNERR